MSIMFNWGKNPKIKEEEYDLGVGYQYRTFLATEDFDNTSFGNGNMERITKTIEKYLGDYKLPRFYEGNLSVGKIDDLGLIEPDIMSRAIHNAIDNVIHDPNVEEDYSRLEWIKSLCDEGFYIWREEY